jgi:[protein-PII] uridylyltransferase
MAGRGGDSAARLGHARSELLRTALAPAYAGPAFEPAASGLMDDYFRRRLEEIRDRGSLRAPPFVLVAVGGYGRGHLCPASDVDILVLFPGSLPAEAESLSQALFHPLWDLGLALGHGVRTVPGCLELAGSDHKVLASLLDARPVAGDKGVFEVFAAGLARLLVAGADSFLAWLFAGPAAAGLEDLGRLEPDLKDSPGGLRDVHRVRWAALVRAGRLGEPDYTRLGLTPGDVSELSAAEERLLAVRSRLHLVAGSKRDRLPADLAPALAAALGISAGTPGLAVERMLASLRRTMATVASIHEAVRRAVLSGLGYVPAAKVMAACVRLEPSGLALTEGADDLLPLLAASARSGLPLALSARRLLIAGCGEATQRAAAPDFLDKLLAVLTAPKALTALEVMLETGYLGALLPELGAVADLVQFDGFHLFPLGEHTVRAVARAGGDWSCPPELFAELQRHVGPTERAILVLAALFHDAGKGGADHPARGAELARRALARLGAAPGTVEDVAFLVANHLCLIETALRRDLGDEATIARAAAHVGNVRRLRLLTLLTLADASATGPAAFNSWTLSLLAELHFKVEHFLTRGPLAEAGAVQNILATRDKVRAGAAGTLPPDFVEACLEAVTPRYVLSQTPLAIVRHFALARELRQALEEERRRRAPDRVGLGLALLDFRELPESGSYELAFAAPDQPRLFATMAGALALHGVSVLSAEIYTWRDGTALDVFKVAPPADRLYAEETFGRVVQSIRWAMSGKLSLDERLAERRASPFHRRPRASGRPPAVRVDNDASDFQTLIEVIADDRLGRLYHIASLLSAFGIDVRGARIGTAGGQLADVFMVLDGDGQKLTDETTIARLSSALLDCLAEP